MGVVGVACVGASVTELGAAQPQGPIGEDEGPVQTQCWCLRLCQPVGGGTGIGEGQGVPKIPGPMPHPQLCTPGLRFAPYVTLGQERGDRKHQEPHP